MATRGKNGDCKTAMSKEMVSHEYIISCGTKIGVICTTREYKQKCCVFKKPKLSPMT